jgi:division protein CdvB (Snf7/Vps24/ESCRT-III family)
VQSTALAQLRAILPWIYAQVMETANRATDVAATQRLVQNFAKQSYELDAKHEMMGEAIDGLDDLDDLEDEMDGVMDSVLAEIGINLATQACPPLPRVTRASHGIGIPTLWVLISLSLLQLPAVPIASVRQSRTDGLESPDDLQRRLASLRG